MRLTGMKIGFALTGSHCTLAEAIEEMRTLVDEGASVVPILSYTVDGTDTKFGKAEDWKKACQEITGNEPLRTITQVEPTGPSRAFDCVVIAPCTGNTAAKLANGIVDSPVLMAAKAHMRNLGPVVVAIATNDGLGANAKNIGTLLAMKNVYFVPFGQDNPWKKANSLVAHMSKILETILFACQHKQIQPLLEEFPSLEAN